MPTHKIIFTSFDATHTKKSCVRTGVYHQPVDYPRPSKEVRFMGIYYNKAINYIGEAEAMNLRYEDTDDEQKRRILRCIEIDEGSKSSALTLRDRKKLVFHLAKRISRDQYFHETYFSKSTSGPLFGTSNYFYDKQITTSHESAKELAMYLRGETFGKNDDSIRWLKVTHNLPSSIDFIRP